MRDGELPRSFGAGTLTLVGIGTVIGAGIFVITGQAAAHYAGPAITLSFVIAGIVCVFCALCYAEMGAMAPLAGSAYAYTREAFGPKAGWMVGWALVAEYLFALSAVAIGWSAYMQGVVGDFGIHLPAAWAVSPLAMQGQSLKPTGAMLNLPAVAIVFVATLSHLIGLKESSRFTVATVIIKLSAVLLFIVFGLTRIEPANWTPFLPPAITHPDHTTSFGVPGMLQAAGLVFFAYLGFDALGTAGQETHNPQRSLPIAILATLGVSTVLYIAVALVMTGLANYRLLGGDAPITAAIAAGGPSLGWLKSYVGVAVSIGLWAGLWSAIYAISRLFFSFARDGFLPAGLGALSGKAMVPQNAILLSGSLGMLVAGFLPIQLLGELISTGTLLAFAFVCAAVIRLRISQPDRPRPFRTPVWPLTAGLGIAACLFLLSAMGWFALGRILVWQAVGAVILLASGLMASKPASPPSPR